jgi:hypothetical protein
MFNTGADGSRVRGLMRAVMRVAPRTCVLRAAPRRGAPVLNGAGGPA